LLVLAKMEYQDDPFPDDDDEEFSKIAAEMLEEDAAAARAAAVATAAATEAAASVKKRNNRFEVLRDVFLEQKIVQHWGAKNVRVSFSSTGFWTLFYDACNLESAWVQISNLYSSGELQGVTKIAKATGADERYSQARGRPILVFCAPAQEEKHVKEVGRRLLCVMNYTQQKCSKKTRPQQCSLSFPKKIYFKVNKQTRALYELYYK
jgi:hypothetical protein